MTSIAIPADRAVNHGGAEFSAGGTKFAETMQIWGGLTGSDRVLDIGCGPGRMAIGIGERFDWANELVGFDVIKVDVDVANSNIASQHENYSFHHIDAWNDHYNPKGTILPHEITFPVEDASVDFAFATSVFTHMFRREVSHYLSEAIRVLKPGGRLLSTWFVWDASIQANMLEGKARFAFSHLQADGTRIQNPLKPADAVAYDRADANQLLADAGFSEVFFYQGAWSRTLPKGIARHSQDAFVATKA